jgi:filamentous hemagglutinin family protein
MLSQFNHLGGEGKGQRAKGRRKKLLSASCLLLLASFTTPAAAQVVPDATLGNGNNSTVLINGIRTDINGGLRRSSALFHSFEQFGILTNHQVYFANPAGIRNIFSRVTGGSISNIDGLLGVAGSANLFFMNPNGIIFGPNARLDVSGSFLATTASALEFPDGQKFAATGDRAVPLVEVNIPIGLQYGANPPAMLTNRGNLATGQDLTLASNNLDLQGQLQAGGNLTLTATDTVKIRDTVTEPFIARSGGDMLIQGDRGVDILALNHPNIKPFVSGGNMSLVSDGIISGDAHYASGGTFQIKSISGQPANFLSLYDPIISSAGDIDIAGTYNGPALLVESLGNIRFQGDVIITSNDPAFIGNANADLALLGDSPALIVRANRNALAFAPPIAIAVPPTQNLSGATFQAGAVPAGITVGGGINTTNNGPVILEAIGPINIGTRTDGFSIFAGSIAIDTNGALAASGILSVRRDGPQRAGNIVIGNNRNSDFTINSPGSRQPSSVTVGAISTRNITDIADDTNGDGIINNLDNGGGGNITVKTTGLFSTTGAFGSVSGQPVVLTDPDAFSIASESNAGDSGNISIISTGGLVNLANRRVSSASNFDGRGGNIILEGISVNTSGGIIRSLNDGTIIGGVPATGFTSTDASGGNVTLRATAGDISAGSINATSRNNNSANSYSTINLTATASSANPINTGLVFIDQATLSTSNLGNYYAGDIVITATNQINITGNTTRNSILRSDGYFGVVDLRTTGTAPNPDRRILIQNSQITAIIPANTAVAAVAPPDSQIRINAPQVRIDNAQINTEAFAPVAPQTRQANSGNITIAGNIIQIVNNSRFETITNARVIGDSGNISIGSTLNTSSIELENSSFSTSANGQGNSGNIRIAASQSISGTDGSIRTTTAATNTSGIAGDVDIISNAVNGQAIQLTNLGIDAAAFSTTNGRTGRITISAPNRGDVSLVGNRSILTDTFGNQPTGDLTVFGGNILIDQYRLNANVTTSGVTGGNVLIDGTSVTMQNGSTISTETVGGRSGNITVRATTGDLAFASGAIRTTVNANATGNGGDIAIASNGGQINFSNGFQVNAATNTTNPLAATERGGDVIVTSNGGQITVGGGATIDARTTGTQAGGKVEILSGGGALSVLNSAVNASTSGSNTGGAVSLISGGGNLNLNGGSISTASSGVAGSGGDIEIASNGGKIALNNGFQVNSATSSQAALGGQGGDVSITSSGGMIDINNNSAIDARTTGTQAGGKVEILSGGGELSVLNSTVNASTSGSNTGGAVSLISGGGNLNLNGGSISTASSGVAGNGGDIAIASNGGQIALDNGFQVNSATSSQAAAGGKGGNVQIASSNGQIIVDGNSAIDASTNGTQRGGSVSVLSDNQSIQLNSGSISTTVRSGATADGGAIAITSNGGAITFGSQTANTGFQVNAQTQATNSIGSRQENGKGGNVAIASGTGDIALVANSTITAGSTGTKDSGIVTLTGNNIALANSQISTSASDSGNAGDITVTGRTIDLLASQIQASSSGSGGSGDVTVTGADMNLVGGARRSEISTSAAGAGASAGNVTLNAIGRTITLQNSDVLASSQQGTSGDINIASRRLNLNNGTIKAEIGQNTADRSGSIKLDVSFRLTLENESEISTLGRNGANGGDISILNVRFLFGTRAIGANGSDIVGRADGGGRGGRVFLDRSTLVQGFLFRKAVPGNRTNDIDTNGQLDNFSTNADEGTRGLSKPLIIFSDVAQITSSACEAVGAKASTNSELRIAGRGGVASSPTAPLSAQSTTSDWVSLELSPQVPVQVTLTDGKPITLEPGQVYQLQALCINAWKERQRSLL